jgi:hypothetical protein
MKKLLVPLTVFLLGLLAADYFLDIDIPKLARGFGAMLVELFTATRP